MAFDAGAIEATAELDLDPFQRGLKKARALGKEFERNPIKVRLELIDKQARERLTKFRTAARRPVNSKLELNDKAARARIDAFRLRAQRKLEIRVDLDDRLARSRLAALRRGSGSGALGLANRAVSGIAGTLSDALGGIPVIGNVIGAAFTGVTGAANLAGEALTKMLGNFSSLGSVVPAVAGQLATLVLSLLGMAAAIGGVIIVANALIGAVVALGGALVALVASLAAAAAGAGLLGVAFLGVLGPAVLVAIGLFTRFQAILKTRQAREEALKQAVLGQKTAEQQRATALDQSRQAHKRLAEEYIAATQAMTRSRLDLTDAELGSQRAKLNVEQARLDRAKARQDLKDFLREMGASGRELQALFRQFTDVDFHPGAAADVFRRATGQGLSADKALELRQKILDLKSANLGYKESLNQVKHSEQDLGDAQRKRADFVRRGVRAYAPYRQALDAVSRAGVRLARATKATTRAHQDYERQLKKLTPTEQGTLSRLDRLVAGFTRLAKAFSDPVFRALNDTFDRLSGKSGVFEGVLTKLGAAFGDVVRAFGRFLGEPASVRAFQVMGNGAAYLVRQLGSRVFINFLRIMRDLARAALPSLKRIATEIGDVFEGWAKKTANIRDLRRNVVVPLVRQFRTWAGLAKDLAGLIFAIFRVAAPGGRSLAESLRLILQRWTRWVNSREGQERVRAFFRDAIDKTKRIVHWIAQVVQWLRVNLPAAAATARHAFAGLYSAIKKVIDAVRWVQNASTDVSNALGLGASPKDVTRVVQNDIAIVNREVARLRTHLSPEQRAGSRDRAIEALQELLSRRGSVGRQINLSGGERRRLQGILERLELRRGATRRRAHGSAVASTAGGDVHFHAHGIANPDQFISKSARKLASHPHFRAEGRREVQRRGKARG